MEKIARDFLLPDQVTGKPKEDSRTVAVEYFNEFLQTPVGKAGASKITFKKPPSKKAAGGAAKPVSPKASVFFEKVTCSVHDDILLKLTGEIRQVDHAKMPITASFLLRVLLEASLINVIKRKSGAWAKLVASKAGKDPGLSELIQYAGNANNGIYSELRICSALRAQTTRDAKDYLDLVIHSKWMIADHPTVLSAANNLRKIIEYNLSGV